jgi:hypothetical protein
MTETVTTPVDQAMAFVHTVFKPFKLEWRLMDPLPKTPGVRLKGTSQGAAIDVVCNRGKVKLISMALRMAPESTILMVHILACVRSDAAYKDADTWLARTLDMLPRGRPGVKVRPWGDWQVEITSSTVGLVTMIVKPRRV